MIVFVSLFDEQDYIDMDELVKNFHLYKNSLDENWLNNIYSNSMNSYKPKISNEMVRYIYNTITELGEENEFNYLLKRQKKFINKEFYLAYLSVRDRLWNFHDSNNEKIKNIIITGHSIGGTIALICALDFQIKTPLVYTFDYIPFADKHVMLILHYIHTFNLVIEEEDKDYNSIKVKNSYSRSSKNSWYRHVLSYNYLPESYIPIGTVFVK